MKHNRAIRVVLLSLAVLLSACGARTNRTDASGRTETAGSAINPPRSAGTETGPPRTSRPEPSAYAPAPEEIDAYADTWKYSDYSTGKERIYRLILSGDGSAQLVRQNGIGELLGLSGGAWSVAGREKIRLGLTEDAADGRPLEEPRRKAFGGEYGACLGAADGSLTLSCENGASPLVPNHEREPITFYSESVFPENTGPETGKRLCDAVLRWYADVNGKPYPGAAEVESAGPEGWEIRLYEDMGDHIATAGLYTISPVTLMGTDDVLGGEIDFSPYY